MNDSRETRHAARMARKKAVVDAAIARATQPRGLLLVLTGNGKGKSSSAFGMVARALGHGMKVAVFQFIKGSGGTGEQAYFQRDPHVRWEECGEGFTWETQDRACDIAAARGGWDKALRALADPAIGLVVLDPAMIVSAPASGQGKTTVVAALARLHTRVGRKVRVFKCGPDFLDPQIQALASGAPCENIDFRMCGEADAQWRLARAAQDADLILIEGVMGLSDGEPDSAELARRLKLPLLLVIDAGAMAGSFGAVAWGLKHYRDGAASPTSSPTASAATTTPSCAAPRCPMTSPGPVICRATRRLRCPSATLGCCPRPRLPGSTAASSARPTCWPPPRRRSCRQPWNSAYCHG